MPKLSVYWVRASLIYMGIGFLFGTLILYHKGVPTFDWAWRLLNPHIELMVFGWTMQFVMGIAFWILPRFSGKQRYGKTFLGWGSFVLLNCGIVLNVYGLWSVNPLPSLFGQLSTFGAIVVFAILIWSRVKPLGGYVASQKS